MALGRLTLRDGRTLAWCEYGPSTGRRVLRFQGMPGSRLSRHPHEESYERLRTRMIVMDRPGFGASTRLAGRTISVVADDATQLLDYLGLEEVYAIGGSGGGPHALAFAALHPDRVRAASVVVGAAPLDENDLAQMIGLNRSGWYAAREGWQAMFSLLAPVRDDLLRDPLARFRAIMDAAPDTDRAVMEDAAWQRVMIEDTREALRPGAEGWADESIAVLGPWDFEPSLVQCSLTWWHGDQDANAPIAATRRLISGMTDVVLRVWSSVGHLEGYRRHDEILAELLAR